jgi:hypothetical protein
MSATKASKMVGLTTNDNKIANNLPSKKQKINDNEFPACVWQVIHQLEAQYGGAGDFSRCGFECPETFGVKILGTFKTKERANEAARVFCVDNDFFDAADDDDDDNGNDDDRDSLPVKDFEGEGAFKDGAESGDTQTFSERVFIKKQPILD